LRPLALDGVRRCEIKAPGPDHGHPFINLIALRWLRVDLFIRVGGAFEYIKGDTTPFGLVRGGKTTRKISHNTEKITSYFPLGLGCSCELKALHPAYLNSVVVLLDYNEELDLPDRLAEFTPGRSS
jgi:hypothetical protein